jgi:DUF4097 and DUF4098 domain-containing protein YvlB
MDHMGRGRQARRWPRLVAGLAAVTIAAVAVGGCARAARAVAATDTVDLSLDVPSGTPVRVETFNGGIEVRLGPGPGVSAQVTRIGHGVDKRGAEADRDAIEVTLEQVDGVARLRARYTPDPNSIPSGTGAAVSLAVPDRTPLELDTSNGPIMVAAMGAGIDVRTSNGPVELTEVAGHVSVETSNGPITLVTKEPVSVDLGTSNGGVTFHGALLSGDSAISTSNGPVDVQLPSNATTSSAFPLVGTTGDGSMSGTVGPASEAALTHLSVTTSNGPIRLLTD